jgi:hypothetical protein
MDTTITPMQKMLQECDGNEELIGERIAGVLEFLTLRAVMDSPFTIFTDDERAVAIFAANEDVQPIVDALPENVRGWNEFVADEFITDRDLGDEQEVTDEPAPEQE